MIDPVSGEPLSDQRLCWLAAREQLRRRPPGRPARTGFGEVLSWLNRAVSRVIMPDQNRELRSDQMAAAAVVDDLSRRLTPQERQLLRQTGDVPDWFLPAVYASVEQLRQ
jgi:hypothetical protein